MPWDIILRIGHVVATVLGVGGATFAEIFYLKAMKDGHIDPMESDFLKTIYRVLRIGVVLLVISGFGFFILFRLDGNTARLYSDRYIAKLALTIIIFLNAILLSVRKIPFWLGGALSITSWYAALLLGVWRGIPSWFATIKNGKWILDSKDPNFVPMSLLEMTIWYLIAVAIVVVVLHYIRKIYLKTPTQTPQ